MRTLECLRAKARPGLDPGWVPVRDENASEQEAGASVPIQSERKKAQVTKALMQLKESPLASCPQRRREQHPGVVATPSIAVATCTGRACCQTRQATR